MDGRKATGKTIGEVEKLTGIPKRELKYFMEQNIMCPSGRTESGYWSYSDEDIRKAQLAALCRELDFPVSVIRTIVADPVSCWAQELEHQIVRLTEKLECTEGQLRLAECLRYSEVWEALQTYCDSLAKKDAALTAK